MNRSEFVFAAIDVLFHPFQNYISYKGQTIEKDIPYGDLPDQKFDAYYRKSDKPLPVVINIHGGGFVKGDKKHRKSISEMYAERGWFVINANYRLAPKHIFPAHIQDMFLLLQKLPDFATKYNLDLTRLIFTGDSSGAYTAAYMEAALLNKDIRTTLSLPDCDIRPSGLLLYCGPYDVLTALGRPIPFGMTKSIAESILGFKLNKDFSNKFDYQYAKILAPTDFVTAEWCPTCLTYAEQDFFCAGQGQILYNKLKDLNVPVWEAHSTKFMDNHCYHFNFWTKTSKTTMKVALDFLDKMKG